MFFSENLVIFRFFSELSDLFGKLTCFGKFSVNFINFFLFNFRHRFGKFSQFFFIKNFPYQCMRRSSGRSRTACRARPPRCQSACSSCCRLQVVQVRPRVLLLQARLHLQKRRKQTGWKRPKSDQRMSKGCWNGIKWKKLILNQNKWNKLITKTDNWSKAKKRSDMPDRAIDSIFSKIVKRRNGQISLKI